MVVKIGWAFPPGHDGWKLMVAGYSQMELCVLPGPFSARAALLAAFADDHDIHGRVASKLYDVARGGDPGDVTQGQSDQVAGFNVFYETILAQYCQTGYVTTILGRGRKVQGVCDPSLRGSSRQRNLPERTAINTVIQGSAADVINGRLNQRAPSIAA